jgi:prepilin-type processing-associated H-X9-DG protein
MSRPIHSGKARRPRAAGAFTLIELLVVVSIIVLLIALLMPALQKTREAARTSACMSNMRQLSTAARDYTLDYQRFPQPFRDADIPDAADAEKAIWFNALDPYLGGKPLAYNKSNTDLRNYMPIKQDPVWSGFEEPIRKNQRTIKMNEYFGDLSGGEWKFFSANAPEQPSRTVLFVDGRAYDIRPSDTGTAGQFHSKEATVGLRHKDGANVSFADNHVEHVIQAIRGDTAAPSWWEDPNPLQELAWRLKRP